MVFVMRPAAMVVLLLLVATGRARAGLHYSGEQYARLPAQWRGFLLDQRLLRNLAIQPKTDAEAGPLRRAYQTESKKLQARAAEHRLNADDAADLGALYIRLGEPGRALELLRAEHAKYPRHFAIAANLGTAWQLLGELRQASAVLEVAVQLAPGRLLPYEQAHLKLVRSRMHAKSNELDDLFGIQYADEKGTYQAGKLAASQMKKLPVKAVAIVQQLALWFPADGRLLWQLAELANAHGDLRTAAAIMDGCVGQFGMNHPDLRKRRLILRAAVEDLPMLKLGVNQEHSGEHAGSLTFRSRRPLLSRRDIAGLPAIDAGGVNPIPWELFAETTLAKPFRPDFPRHLQALDGKQVSLTGFMYPLREDPEMTAFLFLESPVGCWFCEMPETTSIVVVELAPKRATRFQRGLLRITGRLRLNRLDPEEFLYSVKDATVGAID